MNIDRDKFLTKQLGECWHEKLPNGKCICGKSAVGIISGNNDFSTWEGFGKLWEFCQKQDWYKRFKSSDAVDLFGIPECRITIPDKLIHPDKFADAVYNFLKEYNKC